MRCITAQLMSDYQLRTLNEMGRFEGKCFSIAPRNFVCLLLFQTKKLCNLVNNKQIATNRIFIEMQAELTSLILK